MSKITDLNSHRGRDGEYLRQLVRNLALEIGCFQRSVPTMTPERVERDLAALQPEMQLATYQDFNVVREFLREFSGTLPKRKG